MTARAHHLNESGDGWVSEELPGLNLARLTSYLADRGGQMSRARLRARLIEGGKSNLTYQLTDGVDSWVLRRPPLGHVLATAHDMGREARVLRALESTPVPVPTVLAMCEDESVLGAPFFVMSYVEGMTYRWRADLEPLGPSRVATVAETAIGTLADLHLVEPSAVGLADFGRPDGYLARQVRRWGIQLDKSRGRPLPGIDRLHERLAERVPTSSRAAVVHGDFRLDNLLVGNDDTVEAVLDWEMATLGDPLADVGLMLAYDALARAAALEGLAGIADASLATGHPGAERVVEIYEARAATRVDHVGFHMALGLFKLAVILEGIHMRHVRGQTVGSGFEQAGPLVAVAIEAGNQALDKD